MRDERGHAGRGRRARAHTHEKNARPRAAAYRVRCGVSLMISAARLSECRIAPRLDFAHRAVFFVRFELFFLSTLYIRKRLEGSVTQTRSKVSNTTTCLSNACGLEMELDTHASANGRTRTGRQTDDQRHNQTSTPSPRSGWHTYLISECRAFTVRNFTSL